MLRACVTAACAAVGVVAAGGPADGQFTQYLEDARQARAELTTKSLVVACEVYYLNVLSMDTYPRALKDLTMPQFGGPPLLKDAKDIIDPWGKEYKYEVVQTKDGPVPFVWTERKVGGKTVVLGRKPPEPDAKKK